MKILKKCRHFMKTIYKTFRFSLIRRDRQFYFGLPVQILEVQRKNLLIELKHILPNAPKRTHQKLNMTDWLLQNRQKISVFQCRSTLNRTSRKEAFGAVFLDPMINHDCLTDMNKVVKHWLNNRRGTWKIIKKAHLGEDGL